MTTATLTLTEFLLARIGEDEAAARACLGDSAREWRWQDERASVMAHIARHDPARVLAECEAKRRIVADYSEAMQIRDGAGSVEQFATFSGIVMALYQAVSALAAVYSDHADYRDDWRP